MKILTINTHSLIEDNYETKLEIFVDAICRIRPDVIAMQEVNQTKTADIVALGRGFDVRCDNHALRVTKALNESGLNYRYFWHGIKTAYNEYEEGLAIITHLPVRKTDSVLISKKDDASDWRTRYALGIKVGEEWFYSIHTGRYDDTADSFRNQWERFNTHVWEKERVWVMGDFNCDSDSDGYKEVIASGWYDTFCMAKEQDNGVAVRGAIDGWRDGEITDMRIDYIFTNRKVSVKSSKVVFNGINEEKVSDHYGVIVEA